jgi:hypothetical protein
MVLLERKLTLLHTRQHTVLEAFNAAIAANPGGIISTLGKPIATQQVPAPQSGQVGRMVVTSAPVFVQYASVAIA